MAFLGVLPESPSFGSQLAKGLGTGLGAGLSKGVETFIDRRQKQKLFESIEGKPSGEKSFKDAFKNKQSPEAIEKLFLDSLPQIEQELGRDLTPKDLDQLWAGLTQQAGDQEMQGQQPQQMQEAETPEDYIAKAKRAAVAGQDALSKMYLEQAKMIKEDEKGEKTREFKRETAGEPKLQELEDKLENYENTGMRFGRLNELFDSKLEDKFPPGWMVGLFSQDGEINPKAMGLLSPEAQEAVKLVADELSGAKDTFGARVTNFDLQSYMKRLPTLLNSAEGRKRVLRDLRLMNKINTEGTQGILDIVDKYGGPGKISVSKATRMYKKQNAKQIKEWRDEFVNPEKASYSQMPDASLYPGQVLTDEETGQKFKSDGSEWVME